MEEHPAVAVASKLTQVLDDAGDVPVFAVAGPAVDMLIEADLTLISRITAHLASALEHAAAVDRPAELAAPSMVAWLRGRFGLTPYAAHRLMRDVVDLRAAPVAAEAARFGAIGVEAAAAIGHAVAALPGEVGPELRAEGAEALLGFAVGADGPALDATELRLVGRHLHEVIDPDAADLLLAQRLEREDAEVHRRRFLSITDDHDSGGVRVRGLLTAEAGATLRAVLGPLCAPRAARSAPPQPIPNAPRSAPASQRAGSAATTAESASAEASAAGSGTGEATAGSASGAANPPTAGGEPLFDERTSGQRMADALADAFGRLLTQGELPASGGDRPQLLVTVDHDRLADGLGVGTLPDGNQLSPAAVRRLACDAELIPAVLGTDSQPLDVGRSARTATRAQRKALALRDRGCGFPGCDRPPGWCEAHHITEWHNLGQTDLTNLVLLCRHHHRVIHHDDWDIEPSPDGSRPFVRPPAWLDPQRRPRRNLQHHVRDIVLRPRETRD